MAAPAYHVVRISVAPEEADRLQGKLYDEGCLGLEETEEGPSVVLKAYFDALLPLPAFLDGLRRRISDLLVIDTATIGLTDASFHPAPFEPFRLVGSVRVVPPPELFGEEGKTPPREIDSQDIQVLPGLAFGSGRHETTRLVARALWHLNPPPASVLDIGTGSGILAVLARRMGIVHVDAVEISEEALENARGNFERNGVGDITLFRCLSEVRGTYDVLLGNLLTPTILHLKPEMLRLLGPGGRLVLSGVTADEADDVEEAFRDFRLLQRNDTEDWSCLTFARPE
jgi:ribosomal protein L11 methylase PrmA